MGRAASFDAYGEDKLRAPAIPPGDRVDGRPDEEIEEPIPVLGSAVELTLADGGGLFEGQALTVPAFAVDSMPDVRSLAGPALRARPLLPDPDGEVEYGHSNRNLAKLATATKVYGHTAFAYLCAWRTPAWVVTVGPDFLAVITSVRTGEVEDDAPESPEAWRDEWRRTLPGFGDVLRTGFGVLLPEDVAEALDELDDEDGER